MAKIGKLTTESPCANFRSAVSSDPERGLPMGRYMTYNYHRFHVTSITRQKSQTTSFILFIRLINQTQTMCNNYNSKHGMARSSHQSRKSHTRDEPHACVYKPYLV